MDLQLLIVILCVICVIWSFIKKIYNSLFGHSDNKYKNYIDLSINEINNDDHRYSRLYINNVAVKSLYEDYKFPNKIYINYDEKLDCKDLNSSVDRIKGEIFNIFQRGLPSPTDFYYYSLYDFIIGYRDREKDYYVLENMPSKTSLESMQKNKFEIDVIKKIKVLEKNCQIKFNVSKPRFNIFILYYTTKNENHDKYYICSYFYKIDYLNNYDLNYKFYFIYHEHDDVKYGCNERDGHYQIPYKDYSDIFIFNTFKEMLAFLYSYSIINKNDMLKITLIDKNEEKLLNEFITEFNVN